jgi:hypothetical protein
MGCPAINCPWPTAIDENLTNSQELINIYPNPSSGHFTANASEEGTYFLYDLHGRLLDAKELNSGETSLYMPNICSAGNYIVKYLSTKGKSKVCRIVFTH